MRLLALLIAALPALAAAQFKWIDDKGRVTYGDNPPRDARNIERLRGAAVDPADPMAALPYEVRRAAATFPLTLYSAPGCAACEAGRELLRARGLPYAEITIGSPQDTEAFAKLDMGDKVPVLMVGRQSVKEFNPDEWHRALDGAGYPRSAQLPPGWRNPAPKALAPAPAVPASAPATGSRGG